MNLEDQVDNIISNLKVIGMIHKNGRLCVRKGSLTIEQDDSFQKIRRWLYNDSRDVILMHIRNTINNAIKLVNGIENNLIDINLKDWVIDQIYKEMRHCQDGLTNLKTTYRGDSMMIANIDVLLERLCANCEKISKKFTEVKPKFDKEKANLNLK